MDEREWNEYMERIGRKVRQNQFPYYLRTRNFLINKNNLEVNQGGMGLGKTFACCKAIQENLGSFGKVFVATPFASIKSEWVKELDKIKIKDYVVWESKEKCCIEKIDNRKFNLNLCRDSCMYRRHLQSNSIYKSACYDLLNELVFPLDIERYYSQCKTNCLVPIIRCGLKERKVIIGDYFGFLNYKMYNFLIDEPTVGSALFIDEAHLIPERVCDYLSKSIGLKRYINKINKELEKDGILGTEHFGIVLEGLDTLKLVFEKLVNILKNSKNKEGVYTYSQFASDFENLKGKGISLSLFKESLNLSSIEGYNNEGKYESGEDPHLRKLFNFLSFWREKSDSREYNQRFQYSSYKKKNNGEEEITLKIVCNNPSEYLSSIWRRWGKIVLLSGTIPEQKYFSDLLGLKNVNCIIEPSLESYRIQKNVLIYPYGNFKSTGGTRAETIKKSEKLFCDVLSSLNGRTIIYVLSHNMSIDIENQLIKVGKNVLNFCKNEDEEEITQKEFDNLKNNFNKMNEGIAIMNILGRVEGQNFINDEGLTVENILIYGYPFLRRGLEYEQRRDYWINKLRSKQRGEEYTEFRPVASKLYQACMRGKRKEEDTPIIILWGEMYALRNPGYRYLYDELKGETIANGEELLNTIKKRQNERVQGNT